MHQQYVKGIPPIGTDCNGANFICITSKTYVTCIEKSPGYYVVNDNYESRCPELWYCDNNLIFNCLSLVEPSTTSTTKTTTPTTTADPPNTSTVSTTTTKSSTTTVSNNVGTTSETENGSDISMICIIFPVLCIRFSTGYYFFWQFTL